MASSYDKQAGEYESKISLLAIRAVPFRGPHGIPLRSPSRKGHFFSREAVKMSSSVATRDLVHDAESASGMRKLPGDSIPSERVQTDREADNARSPVTDSPSPQLLMPFALFFPASPA